jgi:biotin carboxylase
VVGSEERQALEGIAPGRTVTLPLSDPEAAARAIEEFARARPLRAVIPTDDATAEVAARASAGLGLPHNPPEAARAARRKDLMRARLAAAGLRVPGHRLLACQPSPDDARLAALAAEQAYPAVLKPVFLAASRGVIRADGPQAFVVAFRRIEALLARPEVVSRGDPESLARLLVEEYAAGEEVALEGLLVGGELKILALFDKPDPLEGPYFEETLYVTPSRRPAREQETIAAAVARAAQALGLREGPVHAEARVDKGTGEVWILEVAARSIGGLCARALRFGAGIALEDVLIRHALGHDVGAIEREPRAAGVMMLPIPRAGILTAVHGAAEARAVPGIEDLVMSAATGQPIEPLPEGASYLGFLFARGEDPAAVEAALRAAHALLSFDIAPRAADAGSR